MQFIVLAIVLICVP